MKKQYLVILVSLTVTAVMLFGLSYKGLSAEKKKKSQMVKLNIKLPIYLFVGTPEEMRGVRLNPNRKKKRPVLFVPKGTKNIALKKTVIASDLDPIIGEIDQIADDDREGTHGSFVELGPGKQYVQIDLKAKYNIYAILIWHYHEKPRVYRDVVVQVSSDPDFIKGVKTIFNNDHDNSSGFGIGKDYEYIETFKGKLIPVKGKKARYVRLYSNGSTAGEMNHYIEVEVYGK